MRGGTLAPAPPTGGGAGRTEGLGKWGQGRPGSLKRPSPFAGPSLSGPPLPVPLPGSSRTSPPGRTIQVDCPRGVQLLTPSTTSATRVRIQTAVAESTAPMVRVAARGLSDLGVELHELLEVQLLASLDGRSMTCEPCEPTQATHGMRQQVKPTRKSVSGLITRTGVDSGGSGERVG